MSEMPQNVDKLQLECSLVQNALNTVFGLKRPAICATV